MRKQMTIRGIPEDVARKLLRVSQQRGQSVNAIVLDILTQAVGTDIRRERLAGYATWTSDDFAQVGSGRCTTAS
jgi:plasmid stability protein